MEIKKFTSQFKEYVDKHHSSELMKIHNKELYYIKLNIPNFLLYCPDLFDYFLDTPIKFMDDVACFFKTEYKHKVFLLMEHFQNVNSIKKNIRHLRQKDISKPVIFEGQVSVISKPKPSIIKISFECPSCGIIINVEQHDDILREPTRCGCGRKGKFLKLPESIEFDDVQKIVVQERTEVIENNDSPQQRNCILKNVLTSPQIQKFFSPGSNVMVLGIIKELPVKKDRYGESVERDFIIDVINIEPTEKSFIDIKITKEEQIEINGLLKINKELLLNKLINSYAPGIYGYENEKLSVLLQNVGSMGVDKNGSKRRGNIHIAFFGEPGAGKSQLAKYNKNIAPKFRYTSGSGASGVGLTMSAVHDSFLKMWVAKAGALVLANDGVAIIDEFDKISKEEHGKLNEALEHQEIHFNKAGINTVVKTNSSVLVCANPKHGTFDNYSEPLKQMDIDRTLMDRFDLIFYFKDKVSEERDVTIANKLIELYTGSDNIKVEISNELLRKYLAYVKKIIPVFSEAAKLSIKELYKQTRKQTKEGGMRISPRFCESIIRLSIAYAKLLGKQKVTEKEVEQAKGLIEYSFAQSGLMSADGMIDVSIISTGLTSTERNNITILLNFIKGKDDQDALVSFDDIKIHMSQYKVIEQELDDMINKLKRNGEIYEPQRGFYSEVKA